MKIKRFCILFLKDRPTIFQLFRIRYTRDMAQQTVNDVIYCGLSVMLVEA